MTLLIFALALGVVVAAHVLLQRRLAKLTQGILEREEQRRVATDELDQARRNLLYKQGKESARIVARSDRAVCKMSDQVRSLHDTSLELHNSVARMLKEVAEHV